MANSQNISLHQSTRSSFTITFQFYTLWYDAQKLKTGVTVVLQRHPLLCNRLLKHISLATSKHRTVKEQLGAVFPSYWSYVRKVSKTMRRQQIVSQLSQSPETEKYGHESHGTRNHKWLHRQRSAAIFLIDWIKVSHRGQQEPLKLEILWRDSLLQAATKQNTWRHSKLGRLWMCCS
jgi:hypothetical protein